MVDVRVQANSSEGKSSFYDTFSKVFSTWFWCGNSPYAPGTIGSIGALPLLPFALHNYAFGVVIFAVLLVLGWFTVRNYVAHRQVGCDPCEVVIDEVCGQLLTFMIPIILEKRGLVRLFPENSYDMMSMPIFLCSGVIFFRVIDIVKPWPVCFVDKNVKGALGIMCDDLLAAIPAAVLVLAVMNLKLI
ncbi:phosphatidylglycerophosphatase A family protein [Anaplasma bovis]|uniref:phosphatidylglycerophosphatase A family protein n=1 Tax=Anaplasma bovis TaxID=186733 RepID=UPI002FF2C4EB